MKRDFQKYMTVKQASEATNIMARTLRGWIERDRSFPAVKIRGRVFVIEADFKLWLEVHSVRHRPTLR